jgi:hypothetical protein
MSRANPLSLSKNDETEEPAPASEPSRPTEPRHHTIPAREALSTLSEEDFDFHDTIPAPPWLDDAPDTLETPLVPPR